MPVWLEDLSRGEQQRRAERPSDFLTSFQPATRVTRRDDESTRGTARSPLLHLQGILSCPYRRSAIENKPTQEHPLCLELGPSPVFSGGPTLQRQFSTATHRLHFRKSPSHPRLPSRLVCHSSTTSCPLALSFYLLLPRPSVFSRKLAQHTQRYDALDPARYSCPPSAATDLSTRPATTSPDTVSAFIAA